MLALDDISRGKIGNVGNKLNTEELKMRRQVFEILVSCKKSINK